MTTRKERYATVFWKAVQVLGSEVSPRKWMGQPALGLDQQTSAKFITTAAGSDLVAYRD